MKTECVADISMNSVLAEYSRALYEQYGLLMVDTSYGGENPSIINTQEHLRYYAQKNFSRTAVSRVTNNQTIFSMYCGDVSITGSSFALDNKGAVLNRQIISYMGAEPVEGLLADVENNARLIQENALDTTDVGAMAAENQEAIDAIDLPPIINEYGEEEEASLANPADIVNSQRGIGALNLAIRDKSTISKATVDVNQYASHRQLNKGTGLNDGEEISPAERLLLEQYYYEKCSRYGAELEKSLLKYQLEYMIYGQHSDWGNLERMAENLLFWREASNMLYLFSCDAKCAEAELIAGVVTAIFCIPELSELVKYSLLFAWTFAETVSDLNILFSGGRVPLFKSDATWRLSLENMFAFRDFLNGGDLGEGMYYEDYVRARLFMVDLPTKTLRLADIIEMDVRKTAGNAAFKLDHCLDTFCAEIQVRTRYGYDCKIERIYGYEM
ncbi:DUF5702 domain-containing protein [Butyrivibrio sp. XPD2006]|uniref:DUF5702 domain-containing protein n=1 Tax=Butyrivibrio sp. XPD2006 TaxID=1280668 RepID=UPI0003B65F92|nr:DUF5702 domain-containing protein [Butyrivibrio sp. XPD2006]